MPVETASRDKLETLPSPAARLSSRPITAGAAASLHDLISQIPSSPVQFSLGFSHAHDLETIQEAVREDDRGKWDRLVPRQELSWHAGRLVLPDVYAADLPQRLLASPWATGQLCRQLGIPTGYFQSCPPHLQESQFDWWKRYALAHDEDGTPRHDLLEGHERWLLRGKGLALRGVLSSRYARLDNGQLLDCLLPLVDERFRVSWSALTAESFHLRLVDPALSRDVLPGDRLYVGLHVGNSEVGKRSVSIDAILFRVLCSNGLIRVVAGQGLLRQRHVSFDPPRFRERLSKAISAALLEGAAFLERLAGTALIVVPDVDAALNGLGERWGLSLPLRQTVRLHLLASPASHQERLWGLVNALTLSAQGLPPDDRYDLEAKAGWLAEHGLPKDIVGQGKTRNGGLP
jgi:hypothetical protein